MKKRLPLLITLLVAFLITLQNQALLLAAPTAPLSGTYTVSGAGDYTTISAAIADLNSNGISAPVIFRIAPGIYDEQATINNFARTSGANDIVTFEAVGNVRWQYSAAAATSNWVLNLNNANHIVIDGIRFRAVAPSPHGKLIVANNADAITIQNASLSGLAASTTGDGTLLATKTSANLTITNTQLNQGYRAIDAGDVAGVSGLTLTDNTLREQVNTGFYITNVNDGVIDGNSIEDGRNAAVAYAAISAESLNLSISNNQIAVNHGARGIEIRGTELANHSITNNMITLRGDNADSGIYLADLDVTVQHNSVYVDTQSGRPYAFRTASFAATPADRIVNQNNIYVNVGVGGAMELDSDVAGSNHNNLFATSSPIVTDDGVNYSTLAAYQAASGQDAESTAVAITFADVASDFGDLHLAGASLSDDNLIALAVGVSADIDGDPRGSAGAIKGADEGNLTPLDNGDTVSGSYTVGGSSPDYVDVNRAILVLNTRGVKGDVTFDIRAATYDTHANIDNLARHDGATTNPVVFRAADSANRPILRHAATSYTDNWIIRLDDADFVEFEQLNFSADSTGNFGTIISLRTGANDNVFFDNSFNGIAGGVYIDDRASMIVFYQSASAHRNQIVANVFSNGTNPIHFASTSFSTANSSGTEIRDNHFNMREDGTLQFIRTNELTVTNNVITHTSSHLGSVMYLSSVDDFAVTSNQITADGGTITGITLAGAEGISAPGLIANNFISAYESVFCSGINSTDAKNIEIVHNTMYATGPTTLVVGSSCVQVQLKNNILYAKDSNDLALLVGDSASILSSDYNLFYNGGGADPLIKWDDVEYATLADFQAATGFESNSVEPVTPPEFADVQNGDLHLTGASIGDSMLLSTPYASVLTDIDGDVRSATAPYMGADEAFAAPTAVGLGAISAETNPHPFLIIIGALLIILATILLMISAADLSQFSRRR